MCCNASKVHLKLYLDFHVEWEIMSAVDRKYTDKYSLAADSSKQLWNTASKWIKTSTSECHWHHSKTCRMHLKTTHGIQDVHATPRNVRKNGRRLANYASLRLRLEKIYIPFFLTFSLCIFKQDWKGWIPTGVHSFHTSPCFEPWHSHYSWF